ncbi:acetyltransferase (GNAT) family protein [Mucilaginibacter frigoritolerans]|uniref:Acetyltransferase (GNAT) family protein n=1 Tax=Mucilaginibacter frigoritolerans TaxID=652788 RepID=A0A562TVM8_9SPHI|nr:GNAT family N-acetyltransferase [Mucilaginibacter frigoritolerans]TWI97605.1 acetyltransferase (GNAT) family protein [Mucilaginibacter frigoritolerans]
MKKATKLDKPLVIKLLASSFEKNRSVNYIVRQDDKRKERIKSLMNYSFEVCYRFGEVYISDNRQACALVLYPDKKKSTLWLDLKLIFSAIGVAGISEAMEREKLIKAKQPLIPFYYLWFIGVDPLYQHKGIGTKLLYELIADAKAQNRSVLLETSTLENLPWYEKAGFKVYDELRLSYTLYFLSHQ